MSKSETRKILEKYGVSLDKKQGQSHLVDENVLENIVKYANISSDETVLEIGPGVGNLTKRLLKNSGEVYAVERDKRLVKVLQDRFKSRENLELIVGDVLEIDLPGFDKIVANLPYSISSPVTFKILDHSFDMSILMYQKEFAERMVAEPGSSNYSRLSVNVAYRSEVEILEKVSPDSFIPQPEVSSSIVRLKPKKPQFKVQNKEVFLGTVKAAFQHRRQKLRNSLYHSFNEIFPNLEIPDNEKRKLIDKNIPNNLKNLRAEKIAPKEYGKISNLLVKATRSL